MEKIPTTRTDGAGLTQPRTTAALLRLLQVERVSVARQRPAITTWLGSHIPTAALRCSMLANGYGQLLRTVERAAQV